LNDFEHFLSHRGSYLYRYCDWHFGVEWENRVFLLRSFFHLVVVLSLVLFAGLIPCWVRSQRAADYLSVSAGDRDLYQAGWVTGSLFFAHVRSAERVPLVNSGQAVQVKDVAMLAIGGLGIFADDNAQGVFAPFWLMMFVAGIPIWFWWRRTGGANRRR
jgi:hypothetical protein